MCPYSPCALYNWPSAGVLLSVEWRGSDLLELQTNHCQPRVQQCDLPEWACRAADRSFVWLIDIGPRMLVGWSLMMDFAPVYPCGSQIVSLQFFCRYSWICSSLNVTFIIMMFALHAALKVVVSRCRRDGSYLINEIVWLWSVVGGVMDAVLRENLALAELL